MSHEDNIETIAQQIEASPESYLFAANHGGGLRGIINAPRQKMGSESLKLLTYLVMRVSEETGIPPEKVAVDAGFSARRNLEDEGVASITWEESHDE